MMFERGGNRYAFRETHPSLVLMGGCFGRFGRSVCGKRRPLSIPINLHIGQRTTPQVKMNGP